VLWVGRLVYVFSFLRSGFISKLVGFVVDKVEEGELLFECLVFLSIDYHLSSALYSFIYYDGWTVGL
jgi:hypothetical protein